MVKWASEPTEYEKQLASAYRLRSEAHNSVECCQKIYKLARDPSTHPDILDLFALEDQRRFGSRRYEMPNVPSYATRDQFSIPIAVVQNPSTRLRTIEKMRVSLPKHRGDWRNKKIFDAVCEELDRRLTTKFDKTLSWIRRLDMYSKSDRRPLR